ncbi:MAG: hypothetical protein FWG61_04160 [Firmicutes bacterium]|nr:hypothetical protein [Bacillota bacterium]
MKEINIFGYILVAVLFLSAIIMPLFETFFVYRERLMLGHALYNSCRAAAEVSYNYTDMRNINALAREEELREIFADTFATSFGLNFAYMSGDILYFDTPNELYNEFKVILSIWYEISEYDASKTITKIEATAISPYKFKTAYMQTLNTGAGIFYELDVKRAYTMEVFN